jgi:hypothetical protein
MFFPPDDLDGGFHLIQSGHASQTATRVLRAAVPEHFLGVHCSQKIRRTDDAMSSEATRKAPMMPLRELVDRYLALASSFGTPVPLSSFALSAAETERLFSSYDEDYHISRFFHFSQAAGTPLSIDGFPATHVAIDAEIKSIL